MAKKVKKRANKKQKVGRFVYWTPRVLSIIFILFLAMFSLDIFEMKLGFWGTMLGLFMHNIPVFILLIVLLISWKYEWVGGIAFILGGLLYIIRLIITIMMNPPAQWYMLSWAVQISGPAFFIGYLFFVNWFKKRR